MCKSSFVRVVAVAILTTCGATQVAAQSTAPGGFVESATATNVRAIITPANIDNFPARGGFNFPTPYHTRGIRITNADDCGGNDCVVSVGYSYWRNMSAHGGQATMNIFVGLDRNRGGAGPTLYEYNKVTDEVTRRGPLFDVEPYASALGEGWYFSATDPSMLYVSAPQSSRLQRYNVDARSFSTVFDVATRPDLFGTNRYIWQYHSSDDNRVHSATLRDMAGDNAYLGCLVFFEDRQDFMYFPRVSSTWQDFDECQVDKSGWFLVIKERLQGNPNLDTDNRIINLANGNEVVLLEQNGAAGHSDMGHGWMVAKDNFHSLPNAVRVWNLAENPAGPGTMVYHDPSWTSESAQHISHANAIGGTGWQQQYACASGAHAQNGPRVNEIICFMLDGSLRTLIVAPVMTDMNASGGGESYNKLPKGNLDNSGQYFMWTTNMGGGRQDAFLVRVPSQLFNGDPPPPPPQGGDILAPNEALRPDEFRRSSDGRYTLFYQQDGNLVLYGPSGPEWASNTGGTSPGQTVMQGDGNLVIYDGSGSPVCSSATGGNPGAFLAVQNDGNLVIYSSGGSPLWAKGSCN